MYARGLPAARYLGGAHAKLTRPFVAGRCARRIAQCDFAIGDDASMGDETAMVNVERQVAAWEGPELRRELRTTGYAAAVDHLRSFGPFPGSAFRNRARRRDRARPRRDPAFRVSPVCRTPHRAGVPALTTCARDRKFAPTWPLPITVGKRRSRCDVRVAILTACASEYHNSASLGQNILNIACPCDPKPSLSGRIDLF
jgi:hypothetical protein